ncbi:MAG TPA: hypothetical protein PLO89_04375 [Spirochaetota bacterium]|nr:hypothetical protein [Spirochaetota bacterium]
MVKELFLSEIFYIVLDILFGSVMAFAGILAYGKIKKISLLFIVMSGIFLYLNMVFRVLTILNIIDLRQLTFYGIPLFYYLSNYFPNLLMIVGFIIIINEK